MHRAFPRITAALLGSAAITFAGTIPASAHVSVRGPDATVAVGSFPTLTFRVPTEENDASTVKLQINLPTDTAQKLPVALHKANPGWKATTKGSGATPGAGVTSVTWTATAGGIKPGEFNEFKLAAGQIPDTDVVYFTAIQTYSNGKVVRWEQIPEPGGEEPEHPAPSLKVVPKGTSTATTQAATATVGKHTTAGENETTDSIGSSAATGAAAAGVLGAGGGLLWFRRRTQRSDANA
ncbi:YcnI family protein [Streptomyces sp. NPDC048436]|uniref:YcnI family copper-binding membrane protein n=1 Tax=Streptomyces sp. NPDC048436 TaxID=3365550 RepID=UPI003716DC1B